MSWLRLLLLWTKFGLCIRKLATIEPPWTGLPRLHRRALLMQLLASLKLRLLKLTRQSLLLMPSLSKNLPGHTSITRLKKLKKLPTLPLRLRLLKLTLHRQLLLRLVLLLVLKLRRASLPLLLLRRLLLGMLRRPLRLMLLGLLLRLRLLSLTRQSLLLMPILTVQKLVTMPERRLQMLLVLHLLVTRLKHPSRQLRRPRLTRISIDRLLPLASLTRRLLRLVLGRAPLLLHQVLLKLKVMRIVLRKRLIPRVCAMK